MRRGSSHSTTDQSALGERPPAARPASFVGSRLRTLATAQRPSPSLAAVLAVIAAIGVAVVSPDVRDDGRLITSLVWLLADIVGAACFVVFVAGLAWLLRKRTFDRRFRPSLSAAVFGGYALAAVACSAVQGAVHDELDTNGARRDVVALFVARAVTFIVIGVGLNTFLALRNRIDEQEVALRERIADVDRARALLARADEKIRREAAEILHGTVQSRLLAAQVRLERVADTLAPATDVVATATATDAAAADAATATAGRARAELADIVAMIDDVRVNDVRATSHRLHPPAIKVGVVASVRSLAASFEGAFDLDIDVVATPAVRALDDPMRSVIDEDFRLVVYRAMEEALSNAHRHGKASRVEVDLSLLPGHRLQLKVTDDGVGFETGQFTFGVGVASVAARIEDLGGAWWISSAPGQGTVFTAVLPAPRPRHRDAEEARARASVPLDASGLPISVEAVPPRSGATGEPATPLLPPLPPPAIA